MEYGKSRSPAIERETEDSFPSHSLYVEGKKPETPVGGNLGKVWTRLGPVITVEDELKPYQRYLEGK